MKLKTIDEYNKERMAFFSEDKEVRTGIACPHCGDEMKLSEPNMLLLSSPPRKKVHCDCCKYTSSIVA